jgi:hypothetical protein
VARWSGRACGRCRPCHVSDRLERRESGHHRCAHPGRADGRAGVNQNSLEAYDEKLCGPISQLILRNRGAGPFGLLNIVDERCGGEFDNIDDVVPPAERDEFMAKYKAAAGFAVEQLNEAAPTIAAGAKLRQPVEA